MAPAANGAHLPFIQFNSCYGKSQDAALVPPHSFERAVSACVQVFGRRQDVLSTRSCGRRPKSAKARNRGGWGTRRGSERYGDLGGSCVPVQFDGSGADDRFRSTNFGIDFERAPCALSERIWGVAAGRCGATMQAGALPGESEPEWRWSMRWRINGADIMRCRS